MSARYGFPAALFALKCYAAAMLALYIALRIGLPRPYWAVSTAIIVSQPLAGAVLSKAIFRLVGTVVGGAAAVLMVPNLVNAPELLVLAFGLWLGLCVFVSVLDRTPRSYLFVLAGYSACIIGLPSVDAPGDIFQTAILRTQEIGIGILCASLIHGVVFPGSVAGLVLRRVDGMLRDAEIWSRDSLAEEDVPDLDRERRRLALDISELHQLSVHLPFETSRIAPRVRTVRALQDQLSLLLPLAAAVDDRMKMLVRDGRPLHGAIAALIEDTREWLADPGTDLAARDAAAERLRARCARLEPVVTPDLAWDDALRLSLLSRLSSLIAAHRDCRDLRDQMQTHSRQPVTARVAELLEQRRNRELHRDYAGALRAAFGAALTVIVGCALWIGSGWQDGGGAVMIAGIFLALFASVDDATVPLKIFMVGTVIAVLAGAIYAFAILPRLDGFPMLAIAFAPVLLIAGSLMASPRYGPVALATMMGFASPSLIAAHYDSQFAPYVNGGIAQIVGIWFAIVMSRLLQSAGAEGAVRRIVKAGWADIAGRSNSAATPDLRGWINRMLDRVALLVPRVSGRGEDAGQPLFAALRDLRTGVAIGELRQLRMDLPPAERAPITPVLRDVGAYYGGLDPANPLPPEAGLLDRIDGALAAIITNPSAETRRAGALALVSLRRNLFPDAPAYGKVAA
ncbi:FUSC family protein [Sphingomonas sp. KC8]|uniref:FUSC family protein n=1 Tax=Sphingomonas sp. KC8 TaxID=1030157 RepID=UPI00024885DF|nr:FUSC family protein [Sphingomonas sp. KC8]ARS27548.1 fusaric acid resistance protein FusB/FusC [Sphingomonas sp. KC8]